MNLKIFLSSIIAFLFLTESTFAQQQSDSLISEQTIQITQIYKPKVRQTKKANLTPTLPVPDTSKLQYHYTVPQQSLTYSYQSQPIRPLALGGGEEEKPFENYAKIGGGNLYSLLIDAGIGGLQTEKIQSTFHISHLNQRGKLQDQQVSHSKIEGTGKYYLGEQHFIDATLFARNRRHRYYGYDHDIYNYTTDAIQQSFTDGGLEIGFQNINRNKANFDYHPQISFGILGDRFDGRETRMGYNLPIKYSFSQLGGSGVFSDVSGSVSLTLDGQFIFFKNSNTATNSSLIGFRPAFEMIYQNYGLNLELSPVIGNKQFYLLPNIKAYAKLLDQKLIINAGWKTEAIQNSYLNLSLFNPFINNLLSDISITKTNKFYAGFETDAARFFSFGASLAWKQWDNMPLFVNDYNHNLDGKTFTIQYAPYMNAIGVDAFFNYQPSDKIHASLKGTWDNFFYTNPLDHFGYPALQLEGLVETHLLEQLHVHAGFLLMNGIYHLERQINIDVPIASPTIFDLSLGAEYNFIPRLSAFVQLNNITNQKYQRWNQYPVNGINVIGGVRFKF